MNIGISTPTIQYPEGGVGTYMRGLLAGLARLDYRNQYTLFGNRASFDDLGVCSCHYQLVDRGLLTHGRGLRLVWEQTLFPLECSLRRIDLIHAMQFVVPLLGGCQKIVTIYDMGFFSHPQYHQKKKVLYFQNMIRSSVRRSDLILTISHAVKAEICEMLKVTDDRVVVTHLAPNETYRRLQAGEEVQATLRRYGIRKPYLLFVGTLEPRKNLHNLIRAFSRCRNENNIEASLVITGRQGWQYDLDQVIRESGVAADVCLTGIVSPDELVHLYNGAHVFAYPSFYEGFGIPVLEAMACGTAVITSNISATAEVAGGAAHLVHPGSVESIAEGIERLWTDEAYRNTLRERGLERAAQFSWERCAAQTLQAYEML